MNRFEFLRRLTLLTGAAVAGCATQTPSKKKQEIRVLTYNIHHGEGRDGQFDLFRIADVIRDSKSDLVALQEVDRGVARTQGRDLPAELSGLTGLTAIFSNNHDVEGGEYGNAILSRFPVKRVANLHYRPIREGEQRGLLQAVLDINGTELAFLNTHLDHRADDVERLASADDIETILGQYDQMPIVFCGDFNALPGSRVYVRMAERFRDSWKTAGRGAGDTYPSEGPTKRIDYVWVKGAEATDAEVITSSGSDHAALRVTVRIT